MNGSSKSQAALKHVPYYCTFQWWSEANYKRKNGKNELLSILIIICWLELDVARCCEVLTCSSSPFWDMVAASVQLERWLGQPVVCGLREADLLWQADSFKSSALRKNYCQWESIAQTSMLMFWTTAYNLSMVCVFLGRNINQLWSRTPCNSMATCAAFQESDWLDISRKPSFSDNVHQDKSMVTNKPNEG